MIIYIWPNKKRRYFLAAVSEFYKRYSDVKDLKEKFSLSIGPFSFEVSNASIQLELIDFQNDSAIKDRYREVVIPKIFLFW